jgi:ABC-type transport system involved in cytochrome bd biosynthesis fused ATPase/permease subunit
MRLFKGPGLQELNYRVTEVVSMLITAVALSYFYRFIPIMFRIVVVPAALLCSLLLAKWVNKKWR